MLDRLPHTATAKRRRQTADGMMGVKETYPTTLFTDRACWRQPASDREVEYWMRQDIEITHKVYFSTDPGLDESYVLEIGGDLLDVISHAEPDKSVGLGILYRVMTRKTGTV
ncbi:MAG: hypothetical protein Q7N50_03360 [Armatimonadota bacterium]|nr:hypothetical protein [Armatimonadota bacterium]